MYLPDVDGQKRPLNRKFVFEIFATICPHFAQQILTAANEAREKQHVPDGEKLAIPEVLLDELLSVSMKSQVRNR